VRIGDKASGTTLNAQAACRAGIAGAELKV
jgi:hypothetical protein